MKRLKSIIDTRLDMANCSHVKLLPIGDIHFGHKATNVEKFTDYINYIKKTPNAYMLGMGDYIENATRYSVGAGVYEQTIPPQEQLEAMIEFLEPIKDKIIGLHDGNHERRTYKDDGHTPTWSMCAILDVPYLGYTSKSYLRVGKNAYNIFSTHGISMATTVGGKLNALMKWERINPFEDIYCIDEETEILTKGGWKGVKDISISDALYSFNPETNEIETDTVFNKIETHEEEYYSISMSSLNVCVSPNHRVVYRHTDRKYRNKWLIKPIKELYKMQAQIQIPLAAPIKQDGVDLSLDEIALTAWIITEGHFKNEPSAKKAITISQKEGTRADIISDILNRLGIVFTLHLRANDMCVFYIIADAGEKIRKELVSSKSIPAWAFDMNKEQFDHFLHHMVLGDGCWQTKARRTADYYSKDEKLIDTFQALATLHGYRTRKVRKKSGYTQRTDNFDLGICKRNTLDVALCRRLIKKHKGKKRMWCVTTGNGTIIIRRRGKVSITGNCMGHVHDMLARSKSVRQYNPHRKTREWKTHHFVLTGHFLDYDQTYAEDMGLEPGKMGAPTISLYGEDKWDVVVGIP